jgi:hypothetical protein
MKSVPKLSPTRNILTEQEVLFIYHREFPMSYNALHYGGKDSAMLVNKVIAVHHRNCFVRAFQLSGRLEVKTK